MKLQEVILRALPDAANGDGEFSVAARMWDSDVVFSSDDGGARVTIAGGRVTCVERVEAPNGASIRVRGSSDGWAKMLSPAPPPFYHDLFGAAVHHGFAIEGAIEDVYPYYPALRRLIELLRIEASR